MHTLNIAYYESLQARELHVQISKNEGRCCHRPFGFFCEVTLPIVPHAGDRIFLHLPTEYASFFRQSRISDDGRVEVVGEVKFIELQDGQKEMTVHVTEPGCGPYGSPDYLSE